MLFEFSNKEFKAIRVIRNYLMNHGYIPSVRKLQIELGYKSPRSAAIVIENLVKKGILKKKEDGGLQLILHKSVLDSSDRAETIDVPLVGTVLCGTPIFAQENIEAYIPVSVKLAKPSNKYFLLSAKGDSMNEKGINDGDLVLVKQQQTAENGDNVVALIDDEATIKEFLHKGSTIVLQPRSTNRKHQPIILTSDFRIQGIVITSISL
ncbi:MAG: repressor LexA [Bacteroidales bacterium]|nr:repressor LexA [Bacteroidales bacterium]